MKHAAAVALLLTIAGAPLTTLACIGWCGPETVPVDASCHHHRSGAAVAVTTGNDTCAGLLATSPYLKEENQPMRAAMPASVPYAAALATGEAQLVVEHDGTPMLPRRAVSSLVLRL